MGYKFGKVPTRNLEYLRLKSFSLDYTHVRHERTLLLIMRNSLVSTNNASSSDKKADNDVFQSLWCAAKIDANDIVNNESVQSI